MFKPQDHHIVYMYPKSTFRGSFRSDTLWGLICWGIRMVYGNDRLEQYLKTCKAHQPEFINSSTFRFNRIIWEEKDKSKMFHYFPMPAIPPIEMDSAKQKKIKKITHLPEDLFFEILSGRLSDKVIGEKLYAWADKGISSSQHNLGLPRVSSQNVTHNTIDRQKGGGTYKEGDNPGLLFHTDDTYVRPPSSDGPIEIKSGLFFMVKGNIKMLNSIFRLWEHLGIGGDRSIGKGFFKFINCQVHEHFPIAQTEHQGQVLLSLYRPTDQELKVIDQNDAPGLSYRITRRQGKLGVLPYNKKVAKKPLLMFEEGSVFPGQNLKGEITEVVPAEEKGISHSIYQSGLAFTLPIAIPVS